VAFLYDATDVPMDLYRVGVALGRGRVLQRMLAAATLASWASWRLYAFPTHVLRSVALEFKSRLYDAPCTAGRCAWRDVPERLPALLLLSTLLGLSSVWFVQLFIKLVQDFTRPNKAVSEKAEIEEKQILL
jgi:hypothetical protein